VNPSLAICDGYRLDLTDYARTGLRVGIWASSGRGKSFGVGVLCEELLAAGIPVIAIDPEGELHTLREQYRVLVLGGEQGDLPLPPGPASIRMALGRALEEGLGLVIDLSEKPTARSQQEAARPWLEQLWILLSQRHMPAALVVEEVHIFAPQSGSACTADIMQRFAKQGRKRGAILVAASQRTQAVSKEFMSQLNFPAIGGFETERDYEAVKAVVDGHGFDEFRTLEPGRFFLTAAGDFYRWRPRQTSHGGDSPVWDPAEVQSAAVRDSALSELVAQLQEAFAADEPASAPVPDAVAAERARTKALEQELASVRDELLQAQAEVNRLQIALQITGAIKVMITQEIIARAPALAVPAAAQVAGGAVMAAVAGAPGGTGTAAAASAPAPTPEQATPAVAVVRAEAQTPALVKEVRLTPDAILGVESIKTMIRSARDRARRRAPRSSQWVTAIVQSLAEGQALTSTEFAGRYGYWGKVTINRITAVLDALTTVGYASCKNGQYRLNEPYIRQVIMRG
jgi:hypothetical protein